MCELFAMSALHPTNVRVSLTELARHGGETAPHADGWGIAFHEGHDVRRFREAEPASDSLLVRMIRQHDYCSHIAMVHLRKATQGDRSLRNTQPFVRELGGRVHTFAHNGMLPGVEQMLSLGRFHPVGDTDSEHAFCALMDAMADVWSRTAPGEVPRLDARLAAFRAMAERLSSLGPANFLYSDGDALFVHAHYRRQADGEFAPPGLVSLTRRCRHPEGALMTSTIQLQRRTSEEQVATLFASVPLTDEAWRPLEVGEILVVRDGAIVAPETPVAPLQPAAGG